MTEKICPHGVRSPHECRACEDAIPQAEVDLFARVMRLEQELKASRDEASQLRADRDQWREQESAAVQKMNLAETRAALCHWPDGGWCNARLVSRA